MYEYVKKSEYAPVRKELEEIIREVQNEMREKYGLTFQFQLIGSGKRHLVTRIRGGNSGYDFDYNLIIQRWGNMHYDAKIVKQSFMASLKNALRGTPYSAPKDSTSAITIKVVDKKQSKILHRCDFAIIYYEHCNRNDGYYYLRNNKRQNVYAFVFRSTNSGIEEKVDDILGEDGGWAYISEEYRKLKDINEGSGKHSYSLYTEAVNNVYNQMFYQ
ncbi:MAG: hypothetical protein HFG41_13415 [Coprococcus sp.]|nr:hypothetical protein [Coprococcus sp.]